MTTYDADGRIIYTFTSAVPSVAAPPAPPTGGAAPEVNPNLAASSWGQTIPQSMGRRRMPGNVIAGKIEVVSGIAYFTGMVSWGANIDLDPNETEVTAVYANGAKIWETTNLLPGGWTFEYNRGTETQLPHAGYIALVGAANATANRGLMTGWFANLPLDKFGNVMPGLSAEIVGSVGAASSITESLLTGGVAASHHQFGADWDGDRAWVFQASPHPTTVYGYTISTGAFINSGALGFNPSFGGYENLFVPNFDRLLMQRFDLIHVYNATTLASVVTEGAGRVPGTSQSFDTLIATQISGRLLIWRITEGGNSAYGTGNCRLVIDELSGTTFTRPYSGADYYDGHINEGDELSGASPFEGAELRNNGNAGLVAGLQSASVNEVYMWLWAGTTAYKLWRLAITTASDTPTWTELATIDEGEHLFAVGLVYQETTDCILVSYQASDASFYKSVKYTRNGSIVWSVDTTGETIDAWGHAYDRGSQHPNSRYGRFLPVYFKSGATLNMYGLDLNDGSIEGPLTVATSSSFVDRGLQYSLSGSSFVQIQQGTSEPTKLVGTFGMPGTTVDGIFLTTFMEQIGNLAGLTDEQLTYTDIDDVIGGGLIGGPTTYGEFAENLGRGFDFDFFESDTLKHVRRVVAGVYTVDHVIPTRDLVPTNGEAVITKRPDLDGILTEMLAEYIDESQQFRWSSQPARIERLPTDPPRASVEGQFAMPVIITADQALNCAARALWREQAEKVLHTFTLTRHWLKVEPGDVLQFTVQGRTYTVKARRVEIREDWAVVVTASDLWTSPGLDLEAEAGNPLPPYDGTVFTGFVMTADTGYYTLGGQDATLSVTTLGYVLPADHAVYALSGQDATLTYGTAPGNTRVTTGGDRRTTTGGDVRVTA